MSQPDLATLARLEAATERLRSFFPDGLSLIEVGACLALAAIAFKAAGQDNPHPMPREVAALCDLIENVLAKIATARQSVADVRH